MTEAELREQTKGILAQLMLDTSTAIHQTPNTASHDPEFMEELEQALEARNQEVLSAVADYLLSLEEMRLFKIKNRTSKGERLEDGNIGEQRGYLDAITALRSHIEKLKKV